MKLRFLNKTIENKRFDYSPRYYDARKERLKHKKEQYRKLKGKGLSNEERTSMFRENLREGWSRAEYRQKQRSSANFRTIILIILIVALGYFIFSGVDEVDTIVKKIW
ncbi:MAG: hypothetical protein JKY09_03660 [Crocinitomicaceae bacterium]|nr:hypothetical protein [Crocinitomicaceae bacterium]